MRPVLGRRSDPPDGRDHRFALPASLPALPASYYATPYPTILDQSKTPDCVGFSGASYRASEERRDEKRTITFDGADLYALAKRIDGDPSGDGTDIRSAAKQLVKIGGLVVASSVKAEIGTRHKIASYARLNTVDEILRAIMATGGAWLGSSWYNSWFTPKAGVLPPPDSVAGGHAYRAIGWRGYGTSKLQLRCPNSWGKSFGQGGRFWLPAEYIDFADFDCWSTLDVTGD